MKRYFFIVGIIFLASCNKEDKCANGELDENEVAIDCGGDCGPCPIEYPETGTHGVNMLYGTDTLFISADGGSLRAIVPEGSSLKIELELLNGDYWGYQGGTNVGWSISDYSSGHQFFEALNPGTTDLRIVSMNIGGAASGNVLIKYYENGTAVTKQKVLTWQ